MWFQSEKSEDAEAFKPRVLSITMMEGGSDGGAVDGAGVDVGTISPRLPPHITGHCRRYAATSTKSSFEV